MQGFMLKRRALSTITVTGSGNADRYYLVINGQKITAAGTYQVPYGYAVKCFVSGTGSSSEKLGKVVVVTSEGSRTTVASSQSSSGVTYQYAIAKEVNVTFDLSGFWSTGSGGTATFVGSTITITESL